MSQFDPYLNWLGIPVHEQPPNFYRLLGVVLFESNPQVIEQAADRQSLIVGAYQAGPQGEMCQRLLGEIAMARFNLLDPQQKAGYDAWLQQSVAGRGERAVAAPPPPSMMGIVPASPLPQQFAQPPALPPLPLPQGPMSPVPAAMPLPPPFVPPSMPQMPLAGNLPTMAAPTAFPGTMPRPLPTPTPMPRPASVPVAAPFPMASRAAGNGAAPAPPAVPPAAPLRPMDELERLAAQPSSRRRLAKKKHKADFSKEIVIGVIVAGAAVLLTIIYLAAQGQHKTGLDGLTDDGDRSTHSSTASNSVSEKPKSDREKKAVASTPFREGPLRKSPETLPGLRKRPASSDEGDFVIRNPVTNPAPPNRRDIDSPQDLGGDNDPVMGKPDEP